MRALRCLDGKTPVAIATYHLKGECHRCTRRPGHTAGCLPHHPWSPCSRRQSRAAACSNVTRDKRTQRNERGTKQRHFILALDTTRPSGKTASRHLAQDPRSAARGSTIGRATHRHVRPTCPSTAQRPGRTDHKDNQRMDISSQTWYTQTTARGLPRRRRQRVVEHRAPQ